MLIRRGGPQDAGALLEMFDGAVAWLARTGSAGQWGSRPWSAQPRRAERVREMASDPDLWIAELEGAVAGALIVGAQPVPYVEPAGEPERYVRLLISARRFAGRSVGARLLEHAEGLARAEGVGLVRVDCWAGGGGRLVRYYEGRGFVRAGVFEVGGWPGQVLARRL
ncbi:GNAT family N-acetyltransferase [Allonocardiopsis opalescens]|uniref:Acetyltransferase (GNAT) family protein n=1 Tax=Allonocardiopsis opalescens TaxID=1144618 RepID=A0A2T0PTR1_9ACTN|nr:GNAT family N-acetyltransferase [Allonocardiopsis opalescens]PRX92287.1 acetyltransferase (GNAT) family protein [Allonocardiopsis opalescens]